MWSKTLLLLSKPCSFNSQWTCKDTQRDKEAVVPGKRNVGHSFRRWKTCTVLQMTHNHLGFCSLLQLKLLYNLNLKWFIYMKIHCTNRRISILLLFFFFAAIILLLHPSLSSPSILFPITAWHLMLLFSWLADLREDSCSSTNKHAYLHRNMSSHSSLDWTSI